MYVRRRALYVCTVCMICVVVSVFMCVGVLCYVCTLCNEFSVCTCVVYVCMYINVYVRYVWYVRMCVCMQESLCMYIMNVVYVVYVMDACNVWYVCVLLM